MGSYRSVITCFPSYTLSFSSLLHSDTSYHIPASQLPTNHHQLCISCWMKVHSMYAGIQGLSPFGSANPSSFMLLLPAPSSSSSSWKPNSCHSCFLLLYLEVQCYILASIKGYNPNHYQNPAQRALSCFAGIRCLPLPSDRELLKGRVLIQWLGHLRGLNIQHGAQPSLGTADVQ